MERKQSRIYSSRHLSRYPGPRLDSEVSQHYRSIVNASIINQSCEVIVKRTSKPGIGELTWRVEVNKPRKRGEVRSRDSTPVEVGNNATTAPPFCDKCCTRGSAIVNGEGADEHAREEVGCERGAYIVCIVEEGCSSTPMIDTEPARTTASTEPEK